MSEFKGTKGKWEYSSGDNNSVDVVLPNESTISVDRSGRYSGTHVMEREEMEANALLISKAPEMLKILIDISKTAEKIWEIDQDSPFFDEIDFALLDDLIKEATELK
ncbi:hypothetical protein [Chryseobacterium rhizosphaerae]|uniref:hypothetical protein n=1 Tax=Chryseobacterium rhizosphaerae TaxID=395937 RepID=UPI003D0B3C59